MRIPAATSGVEDFEVTIKIVHLNKGKKFHYDLFRQLPMGMEADSDKIWGWVKARVEDQGLDWLLFESKGKLFRRPLRLVTKTDTVRVKEHKAQEALAVLKTQIKTAEPALTVGLDAEIASLEERIARMQESIEREITRVQRDLKLVETEEQLFIGV